MAFILATVTLFSLDAGMAHFDAKAQPAKPAEVHKDKLLALGETLAALCHPSARATRLDSPATRCLELTVKIAQQLSGLPSSITTRVVAGLGAGAARWVQSVAPGMAPARGGKSRYAFTS